MNFFDKSSISLKHPSYLTNRQLSISAWLESKRRDDGAEGLWRIHDKLYDFINFIERHPGGADWLRLTQGTDITELFETHHVSRKAEILLHNFYVEEAKTPRNYRITFCEDGFYKTLKEKVADYISTVDKEPIKVSKKIADGLLVTTFCSAILAATFNSISLSIFTGMSLVLLGIASHNFLHRRDNFRMFYFNLTGLNYREWRVSHAMSHHMYPNTFLDMEVTNFEPFLLRWIPMEKSESQKFVAVVVSPVVWCILIKVTILKRFIGCLTLKTKFYPDHLVTFALPLAMHVLGRCEILQVVKLWSVVITVASFMIGFIGTTSGHHHPKVYHEGDELPKSMDFGIFQMNANIDRNDIKQSHFWNLTLFGFHTLHHMFPTLDHGLFPQLNELFLDTCREFEIQLRELPWWPLIAGQFQQLRRTEVRSIREMKI